MNAHRSIAPHEPPASGRRRAGDRCLHGAEAATRSPGDAAAAVLAVLLAVVAATSAIRATSRASGASSVRVAPAAHRVDLDVASAHELAMLPGVGPRLAARIAADRAVRGAFASVEDLARVPGVGVGTIEALREHVRVEAR